MPYQETLKESKWYPIFADGWAGDPFKSEPKDDAPAVLVCAIPSATFNTIAQEARDTDLLRDYDGMTKLRAYVLAQGARGWRNIKDRKGEDVPFYKGRRGDGPSPECIAELEGRAEHVGAFMQVAILTHNRLTRDELGN
jgi:hypothetical protein